MSLLTWIIVFCLLGGVLSVLAAASFLLLSETVRARLLPHFVSFAIGAMLGAALLGLLPHALEGAGPEGAHQVSLTLLLGLLSFFLLEKMVLWRHCHTEHCEAHDPEPHGHQHQHHAPAGTLIIIGDAIHNCVDGVLIAAAFLTDVHLGVVTAVAVAAHEIPQEVGDFAILLHSGFSRGRALFFNMLSTLTTVVGGVLAYYSLSGMQQALPYILAVAASSFLYIAVADLIPGLHKRPEIADTGKQVVLISLGVSLIYITHIFLGNV